MILTEEKNYTISLEKEESDSENGLTGNTIELEFSNKELLHEDHNLWDAGTEADRCLSGKKTSGNVI